MKPLIIVVGKKLSKLIPAGVLEDSSDSMARDKKYMWGSYESGEFVIHEPADPDKMIWCAEVTTSGRGKGKKIGVVLESANCGFAVISALTTAPAIHKPEELKDADWTRRRVAEHENDEKLKEYRLLLEEEWIGAIRNGLLAFSLPEDKLLDYTDTVARVEMVKGRTSTSGMRLEKLIDRELKWERGLIRSSGSMFVRIGCNGSLEMEIIGMWKSTLVVC